MQCENHGPAELTVVITAAWLSAGFDNMHLARLFLPLLIRHCLFALLTVHSRPENRSKAQTSMAT